MYEGCKFLLSASCRHPEKRKENAKSGPLTFKKSINVVIALERTQGLQASKITKQTHPYLLKMTILSEI